jgi:hypothetical protein
MFSTGLSCHFIGFKLKTIEYLNIKIPVVEHILLQKVLTFINKLGKVTIVVSMHAQ